MGWCRLRLTVNILIFLRLTVHFFPLTVNVSDRSSDTSNGFQHLRFAE